jgi:TDG/mug DNA glycosylase family protein
VGVTLYRALLPFIEGAATRGTARIRLGPQPQTIHGARLFVLPNPSGRNANFTYAEMLRAFRRLQRTLGESSVAKTTRTERREQE